MHAENIQEHVRKFIVSRFPSARRRELHNTEPLLENGIIDSLGVLDLVAFMEEEFAINVADEELVPENFQTIERLTTFVQSKRNGVAV